MKEFATYVFTLFTLSSACLVSQNNATVNYFSSAASAKQSFVNSKDVFGTRVFVENKGQYDLKVAGSEKVLFVLDHGSEKIYFTKVGLIYEMVKTHILSERERESLEKGNKGHSASPELHYVYMIWVGANSDGINVVAYEKQQHYITFGGAEYTSNTFKKITYTNVYDHIDIEYTIPEDKDHGIKYSFMVHPGADPADIKILYSGEVKHAKQNAPGEIVLRTKVDTIIEHAPLSYFEKGENVSSSFVLRGDTISFAIPSYGESNKTLIIDPWVSSSNSLGSGSYAYDVDFDFGGNVFIYGSNTQPKVAMYNSNGLLQWTFSGIIVNPFWSSFGLVDYIGNFTVDKFSSKTYIGQGVNISSTGARVVRLNANGLYDNFISAPSSQNQEIWDMGFHCSNGKIFVLGGGHTSNTSAVTINTLTGALNFSTFQPTNTASVHDIASHAIDDQGNIFVYYISATNSPLNNRLCSVNATFNGNNWTQPSGYSILSEAANKNNFNGGVGPSGGFNCLGVNANFLFYYDGSNLAAYSKSTGTLVSSTTTGLLARSQGGIAVDDCNRIYVGGNGSILTYSFNGSGFIPLSPISLSLTTSNQHVFDIRLNRNTQLLYVCGSGFAGAYSTLPGNACVAPPGSCIYTQPGIVVSSTSITCASPGSATVSMIGGTGPFSYTWIPSNQTGSVATGLSPGTHTILVYDLATNTTYINTTTFLSPISLSGSISATSILKCAGASDGTAAVVSLIGGSGIQNYLWTNGTMTQTNTIASGLSAGGYSVQVTDMLTGCTFISVFTILQPGPLFCTITASPSNPCVGKETLLIGNFSGGTPMYSFTWTPGPAYYTLSNTITIYQNTAGPYLYNLAAKDLNGCSANASIIVNYLPEPTLSANSVSICPFTTATLIATGAASYTWMNSTVGNTYTDTPLASTSYSVIGTSQGCTASATASVTVLTPPIPIINNNSPVCNGQTLQMYCQGGAGYFWTGPSGFMSTMQLPSISPATPSNSGLYSLTLTALNSCTAMTSATMTVNAAPPLSAFGSTVCSNDTLRLNAISSAGSNYLWNGPMGFTSNLQNPAITYPGPACSGFYTVVATSTSGCINSSITHVTVTALPNPVASNNGPKCEGTAISFSGNGGASYVWAGPNGFSSTLQNPQISSANMIAMGNYTLTVTTGPCTNAITDSLIIYSLPSATVSNNGPVCETKSLKLNAGSTNSITSFHWQGPFFSTYSQNPIRYTSQLNYAGVYTLTIEDIHQCRSTAQTTVIILQNPTVSAVGATVCLNEPATLTASGANSYLWSGPASFQSNSANALVPIATIERNGMYTVMGMALNSCTAITTANLVTRSLPSPTMSVLPKARVCLNDVVNMAGEGGLQYQWYGPNAFYYEGQVVNFVASNVNAAGTYTLKVSDQYGCSATAHSLVVIENLPTGILEASNGEKCLPFCSGFIFYPSSVEPAKIFASWSHLGDSFTGQTFSHCIREAGNNIITGNFYDSLTTCSNKIDFTVSVFPKPDADFEYVPLKPIETIDEVIFTNTSKGEAQEKWNWFFTNNEGFRSRSQNTSYLFLDPGQYPVALVVTNKWGCEDTVTKVVKVGEDFHLYVPNVFTPNGDDCNEFFLPSGRGIKNFHVSIWNRWGAMIFESKELSPGWDGSYKGEPSPSDVYTWKIEVTSIYNENKILTGHVSLLR